MFSGNRVYLAFWLGLFFCFTTAPWVALAKQEGDLSRYRALKAEAEQLYDQKSYTLASIKFDAMAKFSLSPDEEIEVKFRQYDAQWRALASVWQKDDSLIVIARESLEALAANLVITERKNELWAQIEESLGDSFLFSQQYRDWERAWDHYEQALSFWAGSTDLAKAQEYYLNIVFKVMGNAGAHSAYDVNYWKNWLPVSVIEDALKIARSAQEQSKIHYLMAMTLKFQEGNDDAYLRVRDEFEKCLAIGNTVEWYDDALFHYAHWIQENGKSYFNEEGQWNVRPDYEKALQLYEDFLRVFPEGTSLYRKRVQENIEAITAVQLALQVDSFFLPGSEIEFLLRWRNVKEVDLKVYPVDLTEDVSFEGEAKGHWYREVNLSGVKPVWSKLEACPPEAPYMEQEHRIVLPHKLGPGAYIVEAVAQGYRARSFLLITEAMLVAKVTPTKLLAYFCDGENGEPIVRSKVGLWGRLASDPEHWRFFEGKTDKSGIFVFNLKEGEELSQFFVAANSGVMQAFAQSKSAESPELSTLKVYAYTDRPVYYLKDSVRWKVMLRNYEDGIYGQLLDTPLRYVIYDPQGQKIVESEVQLNEYGCAWGSLKLLQDMSLGTYSIQFWDEQGGAWLDKEPFFALEERRLPEFKIEISTFNEEGLEEASFRIGDLIKATVHSEYYSGGAAKDTEVEIIVTRRPFTIIPHVEGDLGWESRYGSSQKVEVKKLKTDAKGNANFSFQIPAYLKRDYEYTIQARLMDDARYESLETQKIRVTRTPYLVALKTQRKLYSPNDRVALKLQALGPYGKPKTVSGTITLEREAWKEVHVDYKGRKIDGKTFHRLKRNDFTRSQEYKLQSKGYEPHLIQELEIKTDEQGEATLAFDVPREGLYRVKWYSDDEGAQLSVEAEALFWVADQKALDVNVHDHLAIITDKSRVSIGEKVPVLLVFPDANQHALICFQSDDVLDWKVVGSDGWAAFVELEVPKTIYPNLTLEALLVSDFNISFVDKELFVPPLEKKLNVEITSEKSILEPNQDVAFNVKVTDQAGNPVKAELSFSVVDATFLNSKSAFSLSDPWAYFYNQKQPSAIQMATTTDQGLYKSLNGFLLGKNEERKPWDLNKRGPLESMAEIFNEDHHVLRIRGDIPSLYWISSLKTDDDGNARVEVSFPEGLAKWRVQARAVTEDHRFGRGKSYVETRLPIMARLNAPQFFVNGDRAIVSGVFTNKKEEPVALNVALEAQGLALLGYKKGTEGTLQGSPLSFQLNPEESMKTSWEVAVTQAGKAELLLSGQGEQDTVSVKRSYHVFEHGAKRGTTFAGQLRSDSFSLPLGLPKDRRQDSTTLKVQVTPSLALALFDALPYLIEYTDKSTETVLNRALAMTFITEAVEQTGIFSDAQLFEEHLESLRVARAKAIRWLDEHQRPDGGWSWRQESRSDYFITAYSLWAMALLERSGSMLDPNVLIHARSFVEQSLKGSDADILQKTWMLYALVLSNEVDSIKQKRPSRSEAKYFTTLWRHREVLKEEGLALLALTAHHLGFDEEAALLIQDLKGKAHAPVLAQNEKDRQEAFSETLVWGEDFKDSRWAQGSVVATSFVLMALLEIEPTSELIKPAVSGLMHGRHGARWSHAQNTSFALLALSNYLKKHPELEEDINCTVLINGQAVHEGKTYPPVVQRGASLLRINPDLLQEGNNTFEIVKEPGSGPVYYMASATYFTSEDFMKASGENISLKRRYYRIRLIPTLLKGYEEERELIEDGSILQVGDRIEVALMLEADHDYEYLVLKDFKPSGFELLEQKSASTTYAQEQLAFIGPLLPSEKTKARDRYLSGREILVWQEPRLSQVAFFVDKLPQGIWEIRYQLRAENPGYFHALPAQASAIYAPAIQANSDEIRFKVIDSLRVHR